MSEAASGSTTPNPSLTKTATGLAIAAVVVWVALAASGVEGPIWLLVAALGLGAAVTGWMAGHGSRENVAALVSLVVGVIAVLSVLAWVVIAEM